MSYIQCDFLGKFQYLCMYALCSTPNCVLQCSFKERSMPILVWQKTDAAKFIIAFYVPLVSFLCVLTHLLPHTLCIPKMIFQLVFLLFHVVSLIVPAWMRKGGPGPAFLKGSASIWQILLEWGNQTVSYQENWGISVSEILCGSQTRFQLNQTIIWKDNYERKRLFCFPQKMKQIDFQSE